MLKIFVISFMFFNCSSIDLNNTPIKYSNIAQQIDSLSKYSYKLDVLLANVHVGSGTGFFVRYKKKLLLISNYHVFTGQNTMTKSQYKLKFNIISFKFKTKDNKSFTHLINVSSIIEKSKSYFFYEYPDLYIYDLTKLIPKNAEINSVEKFIKPSFNLGTPYEIVSIGFTPNKDKIADLFQLNMQSSLKRFDTTFMLYGPQRTVVKMTNSYILLNMSKGGLSGAPVFAKYKTVKNDSIVFAGVISSTFPELKGTLIVKPLEVIKLIKTHTK